MTLRQEYKFNNFALFEGDTSDSWNSSVIKSCIKKMIILYRGEFYSNFISLRSLKNSKWPPKSMMAAEVDRIWFGSPKD